MDREVVELYLDDIIPNRFQPREVFNEEALRELSASIKEHGVIQPIIVRKIGDKYEIIAGERRYKATAMAGLTKIPAIIRNLDDKEASKVALLENLQRKDLTAIEEARTYQKILELDSMTQEELGQTMGKSQAAIANKMRLLSLPDEVQEALLQDQISERHARSLLNLDTSEEQINMLKKIITNRMTVRELDNEIKELKVNNISSMINNNTISVVDENIPKIELGNNQIFNQKFEDIASENIKSIDDDFSPLSFVPQDDTPEILEALSDIEEPELDKNEISSDFRAIDQLLKSTKQYTIEDAVNEIKNIITKIQNKGLKVTTEDMDFENIYQITIKLDKNN